MKTITTYKRSRRTRLRLTFTSPTCKGTPMSNVCSRSLTVRPTRALGGFTILELLLVLVILAVLAGIVGSRFVGQSQSAKIKAAGTQLENFNLALNRYEIDMGRFPTASEGLRVLVERPTGDKSKAWQGPYLDGNAVPKDQWENTWNYRYPGQQRQDGFDLWSNGPDGREGGGDDITNWSE